MTKARRGASMNDDLITYKHEIRQLLHAFGDVVDPLPETVNLINKILYSQISDLIVAASKVAKMRNSTTIGQEELIYLLRNNKVKLRRMMNHLYLKAIKSNIDADIDPNKTSTSTNQSAETENLKFRRCKHFLESIDDTGELAEMCDDVGDDLISKRRSYTAFHHSKNMSEAEYRSFTKCRRVSFQKGIVRFQQWFHDTLATVSQKPSNHGWDLLAYFAHETIAEIVECSLIVQQESGQSILHMPVYNPELFQLFEVAKERRLPGLLQHTSFQQQSSEPVINKRPSETIKRAALKPAHIVEVLRRFIYVNRPSSSLFSRNVKEIDQLPIICLL